MVEEDWGTLDFSGVRDRRIDDGKWRPELWALNGKYLVVRYKLFGKGRRPHESGISRNVDYHQPDPKDLRWFDTEAAAQKRADQLNRSR